MPRNSKKEERRVKVKSHVHSLRNIFYIFLFNPYFANTDYDFKIGGLEVSMGHSFICILNSM